MANSTMGILSGPARLKTGGGGKKELEKSVSVRAEVSPTSHSKAAAMDAPRHSCLKLLISNPKDPNKSEAIFVKATWFDTHFHLAITNGLDAWVCQASEEEVRDRAAQWDQPVHEYLQLAERHLGFQQPASVYNFNDAGDGHRRLSWTFEKEGIKLEWRWKCRPSADCRTTNSGILDFLMDANIRLSEEVVSKTKSFERLKMEAEKCLSQSERFSNEKTEFESATYAKFLNVLNSKKAKLRELRDKIGEEGGNGGKLLLTEKDEESTDKTESFDEEESADEEDDTGTTSKDNNARKRK